MKTKFLTLLSCFVFALSLAPLWTACSNEDVPVVPEEEPIGGMGGEGFPVFEAPQVYYYAFEFQDDDYDMNDVVLKVVFPEIVKYKEDQPTEIDTILIDSTKIRVTLYALGTAFRVKAFIGDTPLFDGQELHDAFGVNQGVKVNTGWSPYGGSSSWTMTATPVEDIIDTPGGLVEDNGRVHFDELDVWIHVNDHLEEGENSTNQRIRYIPYDMIPNPHKAIMIPYDWRWPLEGISIIEAYPGEETEEAGVYDSESSFELWLETPEAWRTEAMNEWFKYPDMDKTMTWEDDW